MTITSQLDLARSAQLFHALSDETRLGILEMLRGGELCVCDLQDAFNAAQSRLSYHLKVLKAAGLVVDRQEGRWSHYMIQHQVLNEAQTLISELAPLGKQSVAEVARSAQRLPVLKQNCCD